MIDRNTEEVKENITRTGVVDPDTIYITADQTWITNTIINLEGVIVETENEEWIFYTFKE